MDHYEKFSLSHFRCFYEKEEIFFGIPNGKPGSGLTVVVGQNNSGKSSLIDGLRRLYTKKLFHDEKHSKESTELILTSKNAQIKGISEYKNYKLIVTKIINGTTENEYNSHQFLYITSKHEWKDPLKKIIENLNTFFLSHPPQ